MSVDHRYNSYIEDAGENVAELEDDIAAALSDIERLAEESELYFQRSQEKIAVLDATVTAIFLPLQSRVTAIFGMNSSRPLRHAPAQRPRGNFTKWIMPDLHGPRFGASSGGARPGSTCSQAP